MADRPIIFSAPMVRALIDGRKTQTRRPASSPLAACAQTDRLWVRENLKYDWAAEAWHYRHGGDRLEEVAGRTLPRPTSDRWPLGVCNSIHMPRWASRLTLIVQDTWMEPLRALPGHDAIAEGVERADGEWKNYSGGAACLSARESYATLWDSLHTAEGERWQDNPHVLVLSFGVVRENIDRIAA
jgi:hypothetical protein